MPNRSLDINNFYHVYNRGVDKRVIFTDGGDKKRFISFMYSCNSFSKSKEAEIDKVDLVKIHAFCLMNNHFHMVIEEICEGGISKYMHKLGTAYSMYFNRRFSRSGTLFQGRFKAKHINRDAYFNYILDYIHMNPVNNYKKSVKEIIEKLMFYQWSSFNDYLGQSKYIDVIDTSFFLDYLGNYMTHFREAVMMKKESKFQEQLDGIIF